MFEHSFVQFPRFTHRIVDHGAVPIGTPQWEPDPNFDLDHHVVTAICPRRTTSERSRSTSAA